MEPKPIIVLLDDIDIWVNSIESEIKRMPEAQGLEIVGFTNDEEAAKFVIEHKSQVIGYIQDLRRDSEDVDNRNGIHFFNQVIDRFTPQAKTIINSASISMNFMRGIYASGLHKRIDLIFKEDYSSEELRQKVLWLLEPLVDKEVSNELSIIYQTPHLVALISEPWEEIYKYIAKNPNFLHTMNPRKFEELVGQIFIDYGWQIDITAKTRDGGYDILAIRRNSPTDLKILIEAKRYAPDHAVGVPIVRSLYGIRTLNKASQVVLATSSYVSRDAKKEFERVVPWELDFLEREEILTWCMKQSGVALLGSFKPRKSA